jgi:Enoyl-CoA hydratase/isomerase
MGLADPNQPEAAPDGLASGLDLIVERDDEAVGKILATTRSNPWAASALVTLLRGGQHRTIDEGLVAESATYSLLQAGPDFARWRGSRPTKTIPPDEGPAVIWEASEDTLNIRLHRPRRHNAFSHGLRDALVEALSLAVAEPSFRRVVLSGDGPSFCSGGDLDEFGTFPDAASSHALRLTRSAARLAALVADRLEVRLHGACMGAGIELAAFARRVVAHPNAVISLPEVGLGLVPGAGGTVSLPRRIGRQRTALLALSGMQLDAPTALRWRLIDELAP